MTFVRQHAGHGIERVRVWRILAKRHQEDGILLSNAIIHSFLQRGSLLCYEIVITDDVVDFHARGWSLEKSFGSREAEEFRIQIEQLHWARKYPNAIADHILSYGVAI